MHLGVLRHKLLGALVSSGRHSTARHICTSRSLQCSAQSPLISQEAQLASTPHYAALPLDRATHLRKEPAELGRLAESPQALFVALYKGQNLVTTTASDSAAAQLLEDVQGSSEEAQWMNLRNEGPAMQPGSAALLALARGLVLWHESEIAEAAPTYPATGGHARGNAQGKPSMWPRTDPACIMLVACGDYMLLGRQSRWAPGRYSLLAGFSEIGETLEQAVVREVLEESGVAVEPGSIRYHSSQPWPFPRSLMIGFTSAAVPAAVPELLLSAPGLKAAKSVGMLDQEIEHTAGELLRLPVIDIPDKELEAARWFHSDWLRAFIAGRLPSDTVPFTMPGTHSLAGRIITSHVHQSHMDQGPLTSLQQLPELTIGQGTFKYILVRVSLRNTGEQPRLVVRGDVASGYHADIRDKLQFEAQHLCKGDKVQLEVLGGGRMEHHPEQQILSIYGFSTGFGQAPHEVTAAIVKRWLPFHDVTISYDGY
ncbi:hypothetical protein WJX73_001983 [Symbiochloris irregularis]|uniref:NAD(+) diphosphatase n=1 Tax=Symbiochloris irregularis TaxID=706552 RepID=A0AAW1NNZ9_9CHLO